MAVVKASFTKSREGAKASIRYIAFRPRKDNEKKNRQLFGHDGTLAIYQADRMIDEAEKGTIFFRLIGGDLDNKKARSEKGAILEQFAILSNSLPDDARIKVYFATGYNRYGEGKPWRQERVRQYFAEDELLIGRDFWDCVCKMDSGYEVVLGAYKEKASSIKQALEEIKQTYLKI